MISEAATERFSLIRKRDARWGAADGTTTIAQFDPFSHFISFNYTEWTQFDHARSNPGQPSSVNHLAVVAHELRHWRDTISTYSGQQYLKKIYFALEAAYRGDEHSRAVVIDLFRAMHGQALSRYYFDVRGSGPAYPAPWSWDLSSGLRFDVHGKINPNAPILFIRFADPATQQQFCRVPFSRVALLECNSIAEELAVTRHCLANMAPDTRIVEEGELRRTRLPELYSANLAEYTACNHLVSNIIGITDLFVASEIASRFAALALSFPAAHRKTLTIPPSLLITEEWRRRARIMRDTGDSGFIFASLIYWLSRNDAGLSSEELLWTALSRAGLPSEADLKHATLKSMQNQLQNIAAAGSLEQSLRALLEAGINDFSSWPSFSPPTPSLSLMNSNQTPCPPLFWADATLTDPHGVPNHRWSHTTTEDWFAFISDIENRMFDFAMICGA